MKSYTPSELFPIALKPPHCAPLSLFDVIVPAVFNRPSFHISYRQNHIPGTCCALSDLVYIRFNEYTTRRCLFYQFPMRRRASVYHSRKRQEGIFMRSLREHFSLELATPAETHLDNQPRFRTESTAMKIYAYLSPEFAVFLAHPV